MPKLRKGCGIKEVVIKKEFEDMRGLRTISNCFQHAKDNVFMMAGVLVFSALALSGLGALTPSTASAASSNDIVYGGIYDRNSLAAKCVGDVKTIMAHYRIDCNLTGVVSGKVCRDNKVYVGNTVVAYDSTSIGRNQKSGDWAINIGGKTYWEGKNSTALAVDCLDTWVKLDANGSFVYAIIKACGNPIWTPKPVVKPKFIQVCDLRSKKIVTIKESDFNSSIYSKNLEYCKEKVVYIQVCEIATGKIITINEKNFDSSKYSKNLADCKVKTIQVCEIATGKVVVINEKDFNSSKYSKNLDDCKVKTIEVCELATKKVVTIDEKNFDSSKYSKNLDDCKEKECVENPKAGITCEANELPTTGLGGMMGGALGLGSLVAAGSAYAASRKDLLSALRNRQ